MAFDPIIILPRNSAPQARFSTPFSMAFDLVLTDYFELLSGGYGIPEILDFSLNQDGLAFP
ncbi:hypothetical protein ABKN59_010740 [Abortiporus biennis]